MIRQSCNAIAKRSLQSRRCIFQQPSTQQSSWSIRPNEAFQGWLATRVRLTSSTTRNGSGKMSSSCSSRTTTTATRATKETITTTRASSSATATSTSQLIQRTVPVFTKEAFREYLPIIGNGAYMALASGFLMTDMLQLRLLLVSGYAGLVTFHALHAKPLLIPLRWSALFVVVNAGAALLLFVDQWIGVLLSDDEKALYEQHFRDGGLTPGQFYYLLKLSKTKEIPDGMLLTKEGQVSPHLYFIEKGQAKVYHHGNFASYVDEGGFVNDVAFQQDCHETDSTSATSSNSEDSKSGGGVGAYGTVVTHGDCKVLIWDQTELKEYLKKHPEMDTNMKYTLSKHLVRSLLKQREIRRRVSVRRYNDLDRPSEMPTLPERTEFRRSKTASWP